MAITAKLCLTTLLAVGVVNIVLADDDHGGRKDKVLYIWAQDQAQVAPDFLAVIDFDEQSSKYGQVINVVPLPPPGNEFANFTSPPGSSSFAVFTFVGSAGLATCFLVPKKIPAKTRASTKATHEMIKSSWFLICEQS